MARNSSRFADHVPLDVLHHLVTDTVPVKCAYVEAGAPCPENRHDDVARLQELVHADPGGFAERVGGGRTELVAHLLRPWLVPELVSHALHLLGQSRRVEHH